MKSPSYKLWRFPLKYPRETHEILAMLVPTAVTTVALMKLEVNQLCLPDHWEAFKNSLKMQENKKEIRESEALKNNLCLGLARLPQAYQLVSAEKA